MSRTDKTRPWWVKASEHPVERHDHADGRCDLPGEIGGWRERGRCYVDAEWWRPEFRCCCVMCDWDAFSVPRRRRERYEARRMCRNWEGKW